MPFCGKKKNVMGDQNAPFTPIYLQSKQNLFVYGTYPKRPHSILGFVQVGWIFSNLDKPTESKASFDRCKMLYWGFVY